METTEIEILVEPKLERPPLIQNGKFYRLFSPKKFILKVNTTTMIDLNFEIKIPDNLFQTIVLTPVPDQPMLKIDCKPFPINKFDHVFFKTEKQKQIL